MGPARTQAHTSAGTRGASACQGTEPLIEPPKRGWGLGHCPRSPAPAGIWAWGWLPLLPLCRRTLPEVGSGDPAGYKQCSQGRGEMGAAQGAQAAISRESWGQQGTHSKGQEEGGSITHPHRLLPWHWGTPGKAQPSVLSSPHPTCTHILGSQEDHSRAGVGWQRGLDSPVPCIGAITGNGQRESSPSCPVPGTQRAVCPGQGGRELLAHQSGERCPLQGHQGQKPSLCNHRQHPTPAVGA